ncbi:MAG: hypothetical protein AAF141_02735 [Pseudomonadota bacterium]
MAVRKPIVQVFGPLGTDIITGLGNRFLGITITDAEGYDSDQAVIRIRARPPYHTAPAKGTKYTIFAGYDLASMHLLGIYQSETYRRSGNPDEGHIAEITCRAADFLDKMKAVDTKHYDKDNGHGTVGQIFDSLSKEAGTQLSIAPSLRSIEMPYRLRHHQSALDFASEIADEIGAIVKPQAGRLVVRERGKGTAAGGAALPPIIIPFSGEYGYEVELEPRSDHKEVEGSFFDAAKGTVDREKVESSGQKSRMQIPHPFATKELAKLAAKAMGQQLQRFTGSASFQMAGNPTAQAGAQAIPVGYGPDVDGNQWEAETVTHDIEPETGWMTTVDCQTKAEN